MDTIESLRAERDAAIATLNKSVIWIDNWRKAREAENIIIRNALVPFAMAYRTAPPIVVDPNLFYVSNRMLQVKFSDCLNAAKVLGLL